MNLPTVRKRPGRQGCTNRSEETGNEAANEHETAAPPIILEVEALSHLLQPLSTDYNSRSEEVSKGL